jgi:aminoglycoside phosphotransferase (APT) family kinase protein
MSPRHPQLPELPALLDPDQLRARLEPVTDIRATLLGVRPFYLRWKPQRSALLGVRLTWQTADGVVETLASLYLGEGATEAAAKAETLRLLTPAIGPALARLDGALYLAFPNDRLLKGLSAVADTRRVVNRLLGADAGFDWHGLHVKKRGSRVQPVRWKPGRRAVLELDLRVVVETTGAEQRWRAFARVMPSQVLAGRMARWRAAAERPALAAPAIVFVDAERGWFATSVAPGRALAATASAAPPAAPPATPPAALRDALATALSALHAAPAAGLPARGSREDLAAAERALLALSDVAPDLDPRAHALASGLRAAFSALPPAASVFTHGDLGADQILVDHESVALIDWDEAANGDPHADWASLCADLRGRGMDPSWVEPMARQVLGERFTDARFHAQVAAAEARRVIEALQRGRADWRERALDALAAAERTVSGMARGAAAPARSRVGETLAMLLDPTRRTAVPGIDGTVTRIGAVWPEEGGAIVRLERADRPGPVARWLELDDDGVQVFDFPSDPALPALASLLASGRFTAAGHRLGKRAALREVDGARFLFLRPERAAERAFARVSEAYRRLEAAGVPASRPLGFDTELGGWWAEAIPGSTLAPANAAPGVWRELGETLARAHAAHLGHAGEAAPARLPSLAGAIAAGRKQVSLVRLADPAFGEELDRDLNELPSGDMTGRPAWIHGDLHPLQILVGPTLAILDWERARVGDAEEDLGNFLAHLAWEAGEAAPAAWSALLDGYAVAGGAWHAPLLAAHARASLARVRAVHGWRDGSSQRARESDRWHDWCESIPS